MKKIFLPLISLLLLSGCKGSAGSDHSYDVYLLIGQSNMAGRGTLSKDDFGPMEGVWLLDTQGQIESASNPLNKYSTIRKELNLQQMGPGYTFARKVHHKTGRKILLVVNARGGSSINQWAENSPSGYYAESVRRAREATRYGQIRAILWHQGESDSSHPGIYMAKLTRLACALRAEEGIGNVPFIAGEIAPWHKNRAGFNPMIQTISAHIDNSAWISSEGTTPLLDGSDPHFSRESQLLLGERYADKVLKMCYAK